MDTEEAQKKDQINCSIFLVEETSIYHDIKEAMPTKKIYQTTLKLELDWAQKSGSACVH